MDPQPPKMNLNSQESCKFLKNLTTIFSNNHYFDINVLIGLYKNPGRSIKFSFTRNSILITRTEIEKQLLTMESFQKSAKYAVANVTRTILRYVQMNDVCLASPQIRQIHFKEVVSMGTVLKKYIVHVHPHFTINYIRECVCDFVESLMQILKNTEAYPTHNIYTLSSLTDILQQFKEVNFTRNIILKGLLSNLRACEITMSSFSLTSLFEMAFYEKIISNLSVLKELLLYSVEHHDFYNSSEYSLNKWTCSQINVVLNNIFDTVPDYLKQSVGECVNLLN